MICSIVRRPELTTEHWDEPAGRRGGDFVVCVRGSASLRVAVGDVSGHGDTAAPRAAIARQLVAQDLYQAIDELTLRNWNRKLGPILSPGFVCLTYIEMDLAAGRVRIANAGNPAVLLRRSCGRVEQFQNTGMVLGVVDNEDWAPPQFATSRLEIGDAVLCFTDGLTERVGPGHEQFGLNRVTRAVSFGPAGAPLEALRRWVYAFSLGECEQDDLTVLCVQRAPQDGLKRTRGPGIATLNSARTRSPFQAELQHARSN